MDRTQSEVPNHSLQGCMGCPFPVTITCAPSLLCSVVLARHFSIPGSLYFQVPLPGIFFPRVLYGFSSNVILEGPSDHSRQNPPSSLLCAFLPPCTLSSTAVFYAFGIIRNFNLFTRPLFSLATSTYAPRGRNFMYLCIHSTWCSVKIY